MKFQASQLKEYTSLVNVDEILAAKHKKWMKKVQILERKLEKEETKEGYEKISDEVSG